jgi:ribosome-binding protein aMBF1 (putative translation factor)
MGPTKRPRSAALRHLRDQLIGDHPARQESLAAECVNAAIARAIYTLREDAGLTQAELARLAHTTVSVIGWLEDADYGGPSLSMQCRLAAALDGRWLYRLRLCRGPLYPSPEAGHPAAPGGPASADR